VRNRHLTGLCLVTLTFPSDLLAGAWTLPAGQGQAILTVTPSSGDSVFGASGDLQPAPRYNKFEYQGLVEYGVTDRLTAIVSPSLQHVDIADPKARRTGLGYTEFGGRYQVLQGDSWVFSGQTTLRVPGTFEIANPAAAGYTDAQVDVRGLLGYAFAAGSMPAFVDLQLAQRFRLGDEPAEFRADVTFGLRVAPSWLLLAQSFNVISEGAGGPGVPSYEYYKLQLSAVHDVTPALSLQLGAFTTYAGRNALQENGVVTGVWYRF
jgi:hypothetical protein